MLSLLAQLWRRLLYYRRRGQFDAELEEEMRFHMQMKVEENFTAGMNEKEAAAAARRQFGNQTWLREESNQMWGFSPVETLAQDVRFGLRMMRRNPGFTAVAVLTLALGIGATTAIFSAVKVVLLNPFPYPDHGQLFLARQRLPQVGMAEQLRSSGPEVTDLAGRDVFEHVAAYEPVSRNLTGGSEPERVPATKVSGTFFSLLGVEPALGRVIQEADAGPAGKRVIVISHGLWQRRFGGTADVIGQKVFLDDEPYTVIGVMPPRFWFDVGEAWFPVPADLNQMPRGARPFLALARLKAGMPLERARAELEALAKRQEQSYSGGNPEYVGREIYLQPLSEFYFGPVRSAMWVLLGAVALILLIACANVANLLLARASRRSHEIAVRAALGAGRRRLLGQMLTESALLALTGGAVGLLLAHWGVAGLASLIPANTLPTGAGIAIDRGVLLFTLGVSSLTALLFGLWPALRVSRPRLGETLKAGGQRGGTGTHLRAQRLLAVFEIALSLILLVMAGLMVRSFTRLTNVDLGFDPENVLTMRLNLSPEKYKTGEQKATFYQQLAERVEALPGVRAVAVASHTPFVYTEDWTVTVDNTALPAEARTQSVDTRTVSADYFRLLGIPLQEGDAFTEQDNLKTSPVAIINQALARRFWPDEDPVGKRLKVGRAESQNPWMTIKGVVADSAQGALDTAVRPEVYLAMAQAAGVYRRMNLAVRTDGDPTPLVAAIKREVQSLDPSQPVYQIQTMEELIGESLGTRRFALRLLGLFALLALVLAGVGVYGLMAYAVGERTHEIGLRLALGAQTADVLRMVIWQGLKLALIGTAIGVVAAAALTRLISNQLFGVSPTDPTTFAVTAVILVGIALVACYVPARRATKVDPMVALRYE